LTTQNDHNIQISTGDTRHSTSVQTF
jgi:hypothetical protein